MGTITKLDDFGLPGPSAGQRKCKLPFLFLEAHALDGKSKPVHKRRVQLVVTDFSARGTCMTRKNKKEERPLLYGLQETEVFCITVFEPVAEKWLPRELERAAFITRKEAMGEYFSLPENLAFLDIELSAKVFRTGKGCYWEGKSNGPFQSYTLEELKEPSERLLFKYGLLDRLKERMKYSAELLEAYEMTFIGSEGIPEAMGLEPQTTDVADEEKVKREEHENNSEVELEEIVVSAFKRRKVLVAASQKSHTIWPAAQPRPEATSDEVEGSDEINSDSYLSDEVLEETNEDNEEFIRVFQTSQGFQPTTEDLGGLSDEPEDTLEDTLEDKPNFKEPGKEGILNAPTDVYSEERTEEDEPEKLKEHSKLERVGEVIRTGLSSFSNTIRVVFPRKLRSTIKDAYPGMVTPTQDEKNHEIKQ